MHVSLTIKTGNTDHPSETWLDRVRDKLGSILTILGVQVTPENLEMYGAMQPQLKLQLIPRYTIKFGSWRGNF
jgi:hypothetical protein